MHLLDQAPPVGWNSFQQVASSIQFVIDAFSERKNDSHAPLPH